LINNGGFNDVVVGFYEDAAGLPGAQVGGFQTIVPTSATVIGTAFGRDVYEIVLDLAPVVLASDPVVDKVYWVSVETPNFIMAGSDAFWEAINTVGGETDFILAADVNNGGWISNPFGLQSAVFLLEGDCAVLLTNDVCAGATPIACGETLSGDTSDGNTDTNGAQYPNLTSPDEWYAFTSTTPGEFVTVSTCNQAAYDTRLSVYSDCTLTNQIAQNDDGPGCTGFTSLMTFQADGSSTYYIAVDGFAGASGTYDISITCELPPANDDCSGAIPILCNSITAGSTTNASVDSAVADDCADTFDPTPFNPTVDVTAPGVWYTFTDTSGLVSDIRLSTCDDATFDTKLSVYSGDCTGGLVCVAANDDDDDCTGFTSTVEFVSDGSSTYYILVHGFGTASGDFNLSLECTPIPPPNDMIVNSIDVDEIGFPYTDPAVAMPAATTENGNPAGCNIDGGKGVWYNFVSVGNGTATASIVSPAGASFVTFFKAPNEMAIETDLEYFFQIGNQCAPATTANITTEAGQAYYVYVVNDGGITDITIDGTLLGVDENAIQGFSFYPNPADNTLNLTSIDTIEEVGIYNLLGQQVIGQRINANSSQLDISSLATGAYLMKVTVNGQVGTYKLIKK
jgi:hypothetical protein